MTNESLEELRERLLRQQNVQQMIQARAYEIYQMRGGKPGGEAQDWFHAEGEVLAFLLASQSVLPDEPAQTLAADATPPPSSSPEPTAAKKTKPRARSKSAEAKPASKKTDPQRTTTRKPSAESKAKTRRTAKQPKAEESSQ